MNENVIYLSDSWADKTLVSDLNGYTEPGWYFIDETSMADGPYETEEEAFHYYCQYCTYLESQR